MSEEVQELARRLVVGRKSDGRCVYDEQAKAELVAMCRKPGASVSRLAREAGVNANQLSRWMRERGERSRAVAAPALPAFVAATIEPTGSSISPPLTCLQARLPNGVTIDMRVAEVAHALAVVEALGRLRCSASTKG